MLSVTKYLLLLSGLLLSLRAAAQTSETPAPPAPVQSWALNGTVRTEQAVPLSGAKVVVVNLQSGERRLVTAGRRGEFYLAGLPADGSYAVEVALKGYEPQVLGSLFLKAGQMLRLSFALAPSPVTTVAALHVGSPLMR